MLALKKKREAEAKAKAEEEAAAKAEVASSLPVEIQSAAATTDSSLSTGAATATAGKVSLLGIGGKKKALKSFENGEPSGKKRTPCEIRIQKGQYVVELFCKLSCPKKRAFSHWCYPSSHGINKQICRSSTREVLLK